MCASASGPVLFSVILLSFVMIQSTRNASRPSGSWIWPEHGNGGNREAKHIFGGVTDSPIQLRAIFTFGTLTTIPIKKQLRNTPAALSDAPMLKESCVCVPFYFCDESQHVDSEGNEIIDVRQGLPCRTVLEVCCKKPRIPLSPGASSTVSSPIEGGVDSTTTAPTTPGFEPQCGTLNPNGVHARVLGFKDSETQFGEYPWQAAILEQKVIAGEWVLKFVCGGSLIWPSVVATAGHCVQGRRAGQLIVRLGEWDTQTTTEFLPHQDIWGSEIVIHPLYYSGTLINDIALIFLQNAAILSPHIDTICLPTLSPQISYDTTSCWATGWGKSSFGPTGQFQAILHEVEVPIVPENVCQVLLRNTTLGQKFNFHPSYLCAGGLKGKDTCVGDGGGPLVCPSLTNPWRYVLVGITSWGVGCGTYGIPGVYTSVSAYTSWIQAQVSLRVPSFDPRKIDVDTTVTNNAIENHNTVTSRPQQYI